MRKRKKNKWLMLGLVALAAILGALSAYFVFSSWYITDQYFVEIEYKVTYIGNLGINVNDTMLAFGKIPLGGSAEKEIILSAHKPSVVYVRVFDDEMADIVRPFQSQFVLDRGENASLKFRATIPEEYEQGTYRGVAIITYTRRMFWQ